MDKTATLMSFIGCLLNAETPGSGVAEFFHEKIAAEQQKKITREEKRNIRQALKATQAKTRTQEQVHALAGKPYTAGQIARSGAIGAGAGLGLGTIGRVVENIGTKGGLRKVFDPKSMASSVIQGVGYGAAIPIIKRRADIEAAKRGVY